MKDLLSFININYMTLKSSGQLFFRLILVAKTVFFMIISRSLNTLAWRFRL
ncbi:hypothetical protein AT1219_110099 [Vibrio alginolyticus]